MNIFPCTASEKRKEIGSENTKEPVLRITKSDSETGIKSQKIVDYTESSELEDDTSDCCQKNVDRDFNTDTPNVKDPMISCKLPEDAQPSSDYEEQDDIPISSKREMLEVKSTEKKKNEELFSSDDENRSNSIVDDIISKLDVSNLVVKDVKDQLVSKSMEAFQLDNSDEMLTDAVHKSAIVVSETGEEINTVPVESTSDTTMSTAQSDSDSEAELVIIREKKRSELMTLLIL